MTNFDVSGTPYTRRQGRSMYSTQRWKTVELRNCRRDAHIRPELRETYGLLYGLSATELKDGEKSVGQEPT